jgi:predicted anti-sigma-YlaC factor YlaD
VRCERFREAVSARLDDEPIGMSVATLDDHLSSCPDCARWAEAATQATRLARVDVRSVPDLSAHIPTNTSAHKVLRRRRWLRIGLLLAGLAQLVIGLPAITGDSLGMTMSMHAAHEAAAWNLAIAVAFVAVAIVPRRAAGLIPLLATFLVVLSALSVRDIVHGAVTADRLATHVAVLLGLVLVVVLDRAERAFPPAPSTAQQSHGDTGTLRTVA